MPLSRPLARSSSSSGGSDLPKRLLSRKKTKNRDRIYSSSVVPSPAASNTPSHLSPKSGSTTHLASLPAGDPMASPSLDQADLNPILGDDDELHDPSFVRHTLEMMTGTFAGQTAGVSERFRHGRSLSCKSSPSDSRGSTSRSGSRSGGAAGFLGRPSAFAGLSDFEQPRHASRYASGLGLEVDGDILGDDDEACLLSSSSDEDDHDDAGGRGVDEREDIGLDSGMRTSLRHVPTRPPTASPAPATVESRPSETPPGGAGVTLEDALSPGELGRGPRQQADHHRREGSVSSPSIEEEVAAASSSPPSWSSPACDDGAHHRSLLHINHQHAARPTGSGTTACQACGQRAEAADPPSAPPSPSSQGHDHRDAGPASSHQSRRTKGIPRADPSDVDGRTSAAAVAAFHAAAARQVQGPTTTTPSPTPLPPHPGTAAAAADGIAPAASASASEAARHCHRPAHVNPPSSTFYIGGGGGPPTTGDDRTLPATQPTTSVQPILDARATAVPDAYLPQHIEAVDTSSNSPAPLASSQPSDPALRRGKTWCTDRAPSTRDKVQSSSRPSTSKSSPPKSSHGSASQFNPTRSRSAGNDAFPLSIGMSTIINARLQRKHAKAEDGARSSSERSSRRSSTNPHRSGSGTGTGTGIITSAVSSRKSSHASPQLDDWSDGFTGLVDLDRRMRQLALEQQRQHADETQHDGSSDDAGRSRHANHTSSQRSSTDATAPSKVTAFARHLPQRVSQRRQRIQGTAGRLSLDAAQPVSPSSSPSHAGASVDALSDSIHHSAASTARTSPQLSSCGDAALSHSSTSKSSASPRDPPPISPFGSFRLRYADEPPTQGGIPRSSTTWPDFHRSVGFDDYQDEDGDRLDPLTPMAGPRPRYVDEDLLTPNSAAAATWTDPEAPGYFPAGLVQKEKKERKHSGISSIAGSLSASSIKDLSKGKRGHSAHSGSHQQRSSAHPEQRGILVDSLSSSPDAGISPKFATRPLADDNAWGGRDRSCSEASSQFSSSHGGPTTKYSSSAVHNITASFPAALPEQAELVYADTRTAQRQRRGEAGSQRKSSSPPSSNGGLNATGESLKRSAQSLALGVRFKVLRAKTKIRQSAANAMSSDDGAKEHTISTAAAAAAAAHDPVRT
ncbi:uncharacterized protein PFL1_00458 [Pseudozyma flocculosa PF-1]|nr:uncharacterized protein PFL1_00458 [Pseudozyma flocculosa PF-1]EPQ32261.1 hypothetical protein PFL1_00458 [Pseudozyma flocculosa PF-1]